jgi:hypothetical protein
MPAVQETIERVRRIDVDQYKYGFVTDIESDKAPKGLSEDTVRFISASPGNIRPVFCAATIRAANSIQSQSRTAISKSIPAQKCFTSAGTRRAGLFRKGSRQADRKILIAA